MIRCFTLLTAVTLLVSGWTDRISAQSKSGPVEMKPMVNVASLRSKAESGDEVAQRQMGDLALEGASGVTQDIVAAVSWYEKAAAQNSKYAMGNLATLYFYGQGVPRDLKKAMELALPSANAGWHQGQFVMQMLSALPEAGIVNPTAFVKWGILAADQGNREAFHLLNQMDAQLTFDQIQEGYMERVSFRSEEIAGSKDTEGAEPRMDWSFNPNVKSTGAGFQFYTFAKAWRQVSGYGLDQDTAVGLAQLKGQASQGFIPSLMALSILYLDGVDIPVDTLQSFAWLKQCAGLGEPQCEAELSGRFESGVGVPRQDTMQAFQWRLKAASHGDANSQGLMGDWYAAGKYVAKDLVEAHAWFSIASLAGDTISAQQIEELQKVMTAKELESAKVRAEQLRIELGQSPK